MAENNSPEAGLPPDVAAILRLADASGDADDGDMAGGAARPAAENAPREEPRQRESRAPYQYRVHELEPTLHWSVGLAFVSWQKAHERRYAHLPEDVQFGAFLSAAIWRDFADALRRNDRTQYDPLGLSLRAISDAIARAEEGVDDEDLADDLDAYRQGLLDSGREAVRQGVSLEQFLDLVQSGEAGRA